MTAANRFYRLTEFIRAESASGVILLACTLVALGLANSPLATIYQSIWSQEIGPLSILHWINDGLMTLFFLVVGLEIKRDLTEGEISSRKKAALPVAAALGGMVVPALIFLAFNLNTPAASGWGIPMATDIAFALGVLTLLGKRVTPALKTFLMALAVVDDIGAVAVIALFYSHDLAWMYLWIGFGILGALAFISRKGVQNPVVYLIAGIPLWMCFLKSGVHTTVAGVLLAMVIPSETGHRLERALHPWVAFAIMPLFALANAGVPIVGGSLLNPLSGGIVLGLVLGKQIGITLFSWAVVKLEIASLPKHTSWRQIYGAACLGGIGFTMSIFISNLALNGTGLVDGAKVAVLTASVLSACFGALVLARAARTQERRS